MAKELLLLGEFVPLPYPGIGDGAGIYIQRAKTLGSADFGSPLWATF